MAIMVAAEAHSSGTNAISSLQYWRIKLTIRKATLYLSRRRILSAKTGVPVRRCSNNS
jgi:hypothetical protein